MNTPRTSFARQARLFSKAAHAEILRLKRSSVVALHAVLALAVGVAGGWYFASTPWDPLLGYDAYIQLIGAGAPLLAGISCGLSLDAEREAGEYAHLLSAPSRRRAYAAKACVLLLLGAAACALSLAVFHIIMATTREVVPSFGASAAAAGAMLVESAHLYVLFVGIAFAWGRNAAIGCGGLGFAGALASLGGLGNGLVTGTLSGTLLSGPLCWIPFTWPTRLGSLAIEASIAEIATSSTDLMRNCLVMNLQETSTACLIGTAIAILGAILCAYRFENGHRTQE